MTRGNAPAGMPAQLGGVTPVIGSERSVVRRSLIIDLGPRKEDRATRPGSKASAAMMIRRVCGVELNSPAVGCDAEPRNFPQYPDTAAR